jgi:hypothetical protein
MDGQDRQDENAEGCSTRNVEELYSFNQNLSQKSEGHRFLVP